MDTNHGRSTGAAQNSSGVPGEALARAEGALRDSVRRFARLFNHSPVAIAILDCDGTVLRSNPRAQQVLGFSEGQLRNARLEAIFPDDAEQTACLFEEVARGDREYASVEQQYVRADGTTGWGSLTLSALEGDDGTVSQVMAMMEDISQRREAQQQLSRTVERLSSLEFIVNESPAVAFLWRIEPGWPVEYVSENITQFGYTSAELTSGAVSWPEIAHPEDIPRLEKEVGSFVANGIDQFASEYRIYTKSGDVRWIEDRNLVIRDEGGDPVRIQGLALDVTDRKRAEEAHSSAEKRFRVLVEQVPAVTYVAALDSASTTLYVSPQIESLIGYTPGEYKADPDIWRKQLHPDDVDHVMEDVAQAHDTGEPFSSTYRMFTRDGRVVWIHDKARIVNDELGNPASLQGVMFDITERKQAEDTQRRLQERLRHQQRLESLGTLAGGVAHEINNPVNGIMNYGVLIRDGLPSDSPLAEFASGVIHESERVTEIVRSLLTFGRQDPQGPHVRTRVPDMVRDALALIRMIIRRDRIDLQVEVPDYLPDVCCRAQAIQQVVMNLMTNARDALNERFPEHHDDKVMRVAATVTESEGMPCVRITVEDHGSGIAPETQEQIFDPFFTTKPKGLGTGLGLSISHGIVEDHSGKLHVESEPGKFTRFHIDLPVAEAGRDA